MFRLQSEAGVEPVVLGDEMGAVLDAMLKVGAAHPVVCTIQIRIHWHAAAAACFCRGTCQWHAHWQAHADELCSNAGTWSGVQLGTCC